LYELTTSIPTAAITLSQDMFTRASPKALLHSFQVVLQGMEHSYRGSSEYKTFSQAKLWSDFSKDQHFRFRDALEHQLLRNFEQYHEHMLIPRGGSIPDLHKPDLFYRVTKHFPTIELEEDAIVDEMRERNGGGVNVFNPSDDDHIQEKLYQTSDENLMEKFFGEYFTELAKIKCYEIVNDKPALEQLSIFGYRVFKHSNNMTWPIFDQAKAQ
jgi:hypothetical protein